MPYDKNSSASRNYRAMLKATYDGVRPPHCDNNSTRPSDHGPMIPRLSRTGMFWGCRRWPTCAHTKPYEVAERW